MKYTYTYTSVAAALAAAVNAQSAPGFPVQVEDNFRVYFESPTTEVDPPGELLPREDTLVEPTALGPADSTRTRTFMLFLVDQDVTTSDGSTVQLLHYFQPNLSGASEVLFNDATTENATTAPSVDYLPPTPPAGDGPHSYTFLLYPQPEDFSIPDSFSSFFPPEDTNARFPFDMAGFAEAANLGAPAGANWFQVENGEASPSSTSTASDSASSTASTSASTSASESTTTADTTTTTESTGDSTSSTSTTFETVTATASTSDSGSEVTSTATATAETTSTTIEASSGVTVIPSTSSGAGTSASASVSAAGDSGAGIVEAGNSMRQLIVGLVLGIAGAPLFGL
ncbi:uncharacterized protein Z518_08496 [Rhinocladiella mackenziei CBS 650.93]|uniref:PEBP-like protein n=1 Tax=Rhinocladiella mackenziei CBS 650.93 TaxID=1442369 RepID=A0A0D2J121_9EURO|nr:uncharacterized protein Z518_08496 [Rhinocladiella mackenziei CBS 650.93]KIX02555.1 hypothetical protein Z518_08496 [Rhinocladiella mackenziei CBS 650.93]